MQQRNKQLSWESNLDYLHGRSAPWPRCHAAKDNIKWENFFPQVFFFASRLRTGYSSQEISDISLLLDFWETLSLRWWTWSELPSQSFILSKRISSRSCLKIREGNDDRNWIYLSYTEVISDAIFFVYPCAAPSQKYERVSHEMAQFVLKIAHLTIRRYPVTVSSPDYGSCFHFSFSFGGFRVVYWDSRCLFKFRRMIRF